MSSFVRIAMLSAPFILLCSLVGCGNNIAPVSGLVTVGGEPVRGGTIMFYPSDGPGAVGEIKPDGTYTLTTFKPGDGAWIGDHKVAIQATDVGPGSIVAPKTFEEELRISNEPQDPGKILIPGTVTWRVPEEYSQMSTSPLTAKVEKGDNQINFDIPKPAASP